MLSAAFLLAAATSIGGVQDMTLAHPGDFEIPRLQSILAPEGESGRTWHGILDGGYSGHGDENPQGFGALGAEVAWGNAERARASLFGGVVASDLSSWLAGISIQSRRTLSARNSLQFRGSYAYQERFIDDPFGTTEEDIGFIVPIPGNDVDPPSEAQVVLDDVTWHRFRIDVSFARTLRKSGDSSTALVFESGVHLISNRFEGVNVSPVNAGVLYPPGTYRTTESEDVWSAPLGAFFVWRGGRLGAAIGVRSDVEFESMLALAGATVAI